jgi:hypothetical protein
MCSPQQFLLINIKLFRNNNNNLPLTGNLRIQTPNKNNSRVVLLNGSHLKGSTERINNELSDKFRIIG